MSLAYRLFCLIHGEASHDALRRFLLGEVRRRSRIRRWGDLCYREPGALFVVCSAPSYLQAQHLQVGELSAPMEVTSIEDLMSLVGMTTGWQEIEVSQERVAAAMQRDQQLYASLYAWLEQHG